MKRFALTISLIAVAAGLLVSAPSAFGIKAGFNLATKRLEAAYKVALFERRFNPDGCYPAPKKLAKAIHGSSQRKVGVASNTKHLANENQVYVVEQGTTCEHLRMALRAVGGIYVLDSKLGTVRLQGHKGIATPGLARTITNLTLATKSFQVTKPDTAPRLQTICPGGRFPIGGGMTSSPQTGSDGEGIYPHSYERLGAQRGWHISVVFLDPSRANTTAAERHGAGDVRVRRDPGDPDASQDRLPAARRDEDRHRPVPEGPVAGLRRLPAHRLPQRRRRLHHGVSCRRHQGLGRQRARLRRRARASSPRSPTARG